MRKKEENLSSEDNVSVKGISLHVKSPSKGKFNMIARRMTSHQH